MGRPSMKHLSVFGAAVRSGAAALLMAAAFLVFWGLIAYGIYIVAMQLGFHPRPRPPSLYWLVPVWLVWAGIFYKLHKIALRGSRQCRKPGISRPASSRCSSL